MNSDMEQYIQPSSTINFHHPDVMEFVRKNRDKSMDKREQTIKFYYAVRDGIKYDPYTINLSVSGLCASTTLKNCRAWCIPKAILITACCRSIGVPVRLGFADIRNYLITTDMRKQMKTDIFYWHGFVSIYLNGKWIKATSAFWKGLSLR